MKIAFIARADNTGLGVESWEFARHFPKAKAIIVDLSADNEHKDLYKLHLDRFNKHVVAIPETLKNAIVRELKGYTMLLSFETFYDARIVEIAREMGIKTVLRVNYEWLEVENYINKHKPDMFIAPSLWEFESYPHPAKYIPYPIHRQVLPFDLKTKAKKFIHIAGNMKAGYDRNGTKAFLEAIPLIKNKNIEIIIKSQVPIECNDKRVRVDVTNHDNYFDIWEKADVYVSPRRYAGQSLPLNEAMSLGMAIMMTDMKPQNQFLPKELLIQPREINTIEIKGNTIEYAEIEPKEIAKKIDEIAGKDIKKYSIASDEIAHNWSWDKLKEKYDNLFKNICQ